MSTNLQEAFENWTTAQAEVRAAIESTPRFRERPEDHAQAYHALIEAQAMAYNWVMAPRMDIPKAITTTGEHSYYFSIGTNCPDFRYYEYVLDGSQTYRLYGRIGDLKLLLVQVHSHMLGDPRAKQIANQDVQDYELGPNGEFEIILSADRHDGNWIPLDPDSEFNFLQSRRILGIITDDPGILEIERIGDNPLDALQDPNYVAIRINYAANFLRFLINHWAIGLHDTYLRGAGATNRFWVVAGDELADVLGSPTALYGLGIYDLQPDESLLVQWDKPPSSDYWSFQLGDLWSQSLDFMNYQTDFNMVSAELDAEGKLWAAVAFDDPGIPNWLDPRGRRGGTIVMRDYRDNNIGDGPTLEVIKTAHLRDRLPASIRKVSAEERAEALSQRRHRFRVAYQEDAVGRDDSTSAAALAGTAR